MSRKSRRSAAGADTGCQVAPASSERRIVLFEPLAHTTRSLAALTPRSLAVTPLTWGVQRGCTTMWAATAISATGRNGVTAATGPMNHARFRQWSTPYKTASLHHDTHTPKGGDVGQRVAIDSHEVRQEARGNPADLIGHLHHRGAAGR